jgi:hypothetical protein
MKNRALRSALVVAMIALLGFQASASVNTAKAVSYTNMTTMQRRLLSGLAELELNPRNAALLNRANQSAAGAIKLSSLVDVSAQHPKNYYPSSNGACPMKLGDNVKVNQNCLNLSDTDLQGRGQTNNETSIAQDPNNPRHLVASDNDYVRGDGNCGSIYSLDNGQTWTDVTVPTSFTRGQPTYGAAREYWGGGGDTSVAWDTKGNAYLSCQLFNRGQPTTPNPDASSSLVVFRSTQNNGASWNFPARPAVEANDLTGTGAPFEDKQLLTVDNHVGSPFQDRVYVTWTEFAATGSAYIWEVYSSDYGQTFSPRHLVSADSPLCVNNFGVGAEQGNCNQNQFSQPFTGPDGALYVTWSNFNNATGHPIGDDDGEGGDSANRNSATVDPNDNHNQILVAKSTDGGNTFSAPVKVADYYDLPDCATYQDGKDLGRSCVPEKGSTTNSFFRAVNYPVGAVNPKHPNQVAITIGSYINKYSNEANGCAPAGFNPNTGLNLYTGVKTAGACNNDILLSVSRDGGQTFTGTTTGPRELTTVNQDGRQKTSDQWWPWTVFTNEGRLAVAYYDRQYGSDENTGFSDVSLSGSDDLAHFGSVRATSSSMPAPTQFAGVFFGDYNGLSAIDNQAHPFWADTRNPELILCPDTGTPTAPPAVCTTTAPNASIANDQDGFTTVLHVPGH